MPWHRASAAVTRTGSSAASCGPRLSRLAVELGVHAAHGVLHFVLELLRVGTEMKRIDDDLAQHLVQCECTLRRRQLFDLWLCDAHSARTFGHEDAGFDQFAHGAIDSCAADTQLLGNLAGWRQQVANMQTTRCNRLTKLICDLLIDGRAAVLFETQKVQWHGP